MSVATIKKTIIGAIARTLNLSQSDIPKLYLSDVVVPSLELSPYIGNFKIIRGTDTTVNSTGTKAMLLTCPSNKRWIVYIVNLLANGGVFTTNSQYLNVYNYWNGSGASIQVAYSTNDASPAGASPVYAEFANPIILNPGDTLNYNSTVSAYTSVGALYINAYVQEFDV